MCYPARKERVVDEWVCPDQLLSSRMKFNLSLPALSLGSTSERGATSSNLRWVGYSQLSAVAVMVDLMLVG